MSSEISSQLYAFDKMRGLYEEQTKKQGGICGAQLLAVLLGYDGRAAFDFYPDHSHNPGDLQAEDHRPG